MEYYDEFCIYEGNEAQGMDDRILANLIGGPVCGRELWAYNGSGMIYVLPGADDIFKIPAMYELMSDGMWVFVGYGKAPASGWNVLPGSGVE